jgi:protein-L-isoaspartate(D-aspartate) O-methyltransferase
MDHAALRGEMVDGLVHETKAAVRDDRVAAAMRAVPRHEFVDEGHRAYLDTTLEHRSTSVLAPSVAGRLLSALETGAGDDVLVVGVGVGYTAAVLAEIAGARHVHAVDISREVVWDARANLADAGYEEVLVEWGDGADGLPRYAPFDRVLIEAAAAHPPRALLDQMAAGGRLVLPRGGVDQTLVAVDAESESREEFGPVQFDPLLVEGEQQDAIERNRTRREEREQAERGRASAGWEQNWIDWDEYM